MSLLTVIIPTFNAATTLHHALSSLQTQTRQYFDIIIQDGNSTDNTLEIANSFTHFFKERLTIYSAADKGIYDAMNSAMDKSNGEWLYFLGADDYVYDTNVFQVIENDLKNSKIHFLYGNVHSPDYGLRFDGPFTFKKIQHKNICHQAIFYRKQLFEKLGKFTIAYKVNADWDFNIRCFTHPAVQTKYVDVVVAFFAPGGFGKQVKDVEYKKNKRSIQLEYLRKYRPLSYVGAKVKMGIKKLLPK